jgi:hypothetical protein
MSEASERIDNDAHEVADRLNALAPGGRRFFLEMLAEYTKFCHHCGQDYRDERQVCHCENDE